MMNIRGILFDLDGTICNTLLDLATATNATLHAFGYPEKPVDNFRHYVGNGARKQLERALDKVLPHEQFEKLYQYYLEYYRTHYCVLTDAYDGIKPMLHTLKEQGIRLAVVTNKPQEMARSIVSKVFGDCLFDYVLGQTDAFPLKPDPASTRFAIQQLGLTAEEILFVGDSDVDILTAHNAGCRAVGVTWGFRGRAELATTGADALIDKAEELLCEVF